MKWNLLCPLVTLLGGCVGFCLRAWQNTAGFDPASGLPLPGALPSLLLPLTLALCAGVFFLLVFRLPCRGSIRAFLQLEGSTAATATVLSGILLLAFSGGMELSAGLVAGQRAELFPGALTLLCAGALLPLLPGCKQGGVLNGSLLLLPAICYTLRLVLFYRTFSANPVLASYYVEILAMAMLILAYFRLASFWFHNGSGRRFCLFAMLAVVLSLAAMADYLAKPTMLAFFGGNALLLLGFIHLCLGDPRRLPSRQPVGKREK